MVSSGLGGVDNVLGILISASPDNLARSIDEGFFESLGNMFGIAESESVRFRDGFPSVGVGVTIRRNPAGIVGGSVF